LKEQYQQYKKSVISAFPKSATASILGTRSGKVRKENGLRQKIIKLNQQLILNDIPKHHRANLIAKKLVCNTEYARRILRQVNNTN
jgi:hypothetical protein